jgi:hypothetical protein
MFHQLTKQCKQEKQSTILCESLKEGWTRLDEICDGIWVWEYRGGGILGIAPEMLLIVRVKSPDAVMPNGYSLSEVIRDKYPSLYVHSARARSGHNT